MNKPLNRIKDIRWEKNISLTQLSLITGMSKSAINLIENGRRIPSHITMLKISRGLNMKMSEVFLDWYEVGEI